MFTPFVSQKCKIQNPNYKLTIYDKEIYFNCKKFGIGIFCILRVRNANVNKNPTYMPAKVEIKSDYALISLTATELDSNNAQDFKDVIQKISDKGIHRMILNMENCGYCNSSGLSAILIANRTCKNNMGNFALCGLQQAVVRLINISQLNSILKITKTVSEAEEYMELN